jgi:hypothetical protein
MKMKHWFYNNLIKYHKQMRTFYETNNYFANPFKVIYHDLKVQRYEYKLGE